jgi:zinc/manganese transport system substrate-binding protein
LRLEQDLKQHKVRLMFYNRQTSEKIVHRLVNVARASKIPVVGVTETVPPGMKFQDWMLRTLDETEEALAKPPS